MKRQTLGWFVSHIGKTLIAKADEETMERTVASIADAEWLYMTQDCGARFDEKK